MNKANIAKCAVLTMIFCVGWIVLCNVADIHYAILWIGSFLIGFLGMQLTAFIWPPFDEDW